MSNKTTPTSPRRLWLTGFFLCAVAMATGTAFYVLRNSSAAPDAPLTFAARRGPLVVSLNESGTIQAQEKTIIKNKIPGRTAILWIIEEGSIVQEGDLLVRLDASQLEDKHFAQKITVQNAEADFVNAREALAITRNQADSDIEQAENTLMFAKQDLEKYIEGEYPQQLREAEVNITLAEEDLQRTEEKQKWSRVLFKQKLISQTELQADELAAKKTTLELELARGKLELLKNHTHARELAKLNSDVKQARMALERVKRKATANTLQAEAKFAAKEADLQRQQDKLVEIEHEIEATRIPAPSDGLVVYATSAESHRHRNKEPLEAGQEVRQQEALIHLPNTARMMATIKVHESHIKKLELNMPARITVDALSHTNFAGRVNTIAPLPDPASFWSNPDLKIYDTEVYIANDAEGLRNGMSCEVEIIIETHDDALYIPIQSVVQIDNTPTAFVVGADGTVSPRSLRVGEDNNRMIHVLEGLTQGERVLLTPPLRKSERPPASVTPVSDAAITTQSS